MVAIGCEWLCLGVFGVYWLVVGFDCLCLVLIVLIGFAWFDGFKLVLIGVEWLDWFRVVASGFESL